MRRSSLALLAYMLCPSAWCQTKNPGAVASPLDSRQVTLRQAGVSLAEALALVSAHTGLSLLADDLPQRPTGDLDTRGSARQALDAIGDLFDYSWVQNARGDILFTKRSHDPAEHPQIRAGDAAEIARSVLRALNWTGEPPDTAALGPYLRALYGSFSAEQRIYVAGGGRIAVRSLAPPQRELVYRATMDAGFGMLYMIMELLQSQLLGIEHSTLGLAPPAVPNIGPPGQQGLESAMEPKWELVYGWRHGLVREERHLPHDPNGITPLETHVYR